MALPITAHFNFDEFVKTSHGDLLLLNSDVALHYTDNIFTVMCVLEFIRSIYKMPITVTSGFRCPHLNMRVKGAPNSKHLVGRAVDICPSVPCTSPLFSKYMLQLINSVKVVFNCSLIGYYSAHDNYIHIQLP